jgi:hypothetical protein
MAPGASARARSGAARAGARGCCEPVGGVAHPALPCVLCVQASRRAMGTRSSSRTAPLSMGPPLSCLPTGPCASRTWYTVREARTGRTGRWRWRARCPACVSPSPRTTSEVACFRGFVEPLGASWNLLHLRTVRKARCDMERQCTAWSVELHTNLRQPHVGGRGPMMAREASAQAAWRGGWPALPRRPHPGARDVELHRASAPHDGGERAAGASHGQRATTLRVIRHAPRPTPYAGAAASSQGTAAAAEGAAAAAVAEVAAQEEGAPAADVVRMCLVVS